MKITAGLFSNMVLQHDGRRGRGFLFRGTCERKISGAVRATVHAGEKKLVSKVCGKAAHGKFEGLLPMLPPGGPYAFHLELVNAAGAPVAELKVKNVLVGDVWILAGQSNMEGVGHASHAAKPHQMLRCFHMNDQWAVAKDPLHRMWECVDDAHVIISGGNRPARRIHCTGPGMAFAHEMFRRTGVPQGLIACAHGGTSMAQWDPAKKFEGGKSLYGATVRRLKKNGGKVRGVLWYQGESDTGPEAARVYTQNMVRLVKAFRRDTGNPTLPFAMVQIGRLVGCPDSSSKGWNLVREEQRKLPSKIKNLAVVASLDLPLDDLIHIGGEAQQVLGKRLALEMARLTGERKNVPAALEFDAWRMDSVDHSGGTKLLVSFRGVAGALESAGRPVGFSVRDRDGVNKVYDIRLKKNAVSLFTTLTVDSLATHSLYYGYGTDPVCNIFDAAGRSLPALGPVPLGKARAFSEFARAFHVAACPLEFDQIKSPDVFGTIESKLRVFEQNFANLHPEISSLKKGTILYHTEMEIAEPMRIRLLAGYDGPFRLWLDSRRLLQDFKGTNPAVVDESSTGVIALRPGRFPIRVALGTNNGRAWGIYLRAERLDVTTGQLKRGLDLIPVPKFQA